MTKTAKQIVGDIMMLLKGSNLESIISGKIYRKGDRPKGSKKEDAVVIFTTGDPSQMQIGVVTINVYCPNVIHPNGDSIENNKRCEELEVAAQQWVSSLTADKSNFRFSLMQTIYTESEPEINQHFVVVKLKYNLLTI